MLFLPMIPTQPSTIDNTSKQHRSLIGAPNRKRQTITHFEAILVRFGSAAILEYFWTPVDIIFILCLGTDFVEAKESPQGVPTGVDPYNFGSRVPRDGLARRVYYQKQPTTTNRPPPQKARINNYTN